jgi:rubrerythrin
MQHTIELLKNAIEAEVRSQAFYRKASQLTEDERSRKVFIDLTEMEDNHAQHLVDRLNQGEIAAACDLQAFLNETEARANQLLEVIKTPFIKQGNMAQVLDFAINQEIKAQENYAALRDRLSDPDARQFCAQMVAEEGAHAEHLRKLRRSLETDHQEHPGIQD